MASFSFAPDPASRRRIPIAEIGLNMGDDSSVVRESGLKARKQKQHLAMYLDRQVGGGLNNH